MTRQLTDIRKLLPVLTTAFQVEQLKMSKIMSRMTALKAQLRELEQASSFDPMGAAARGGADFLWENWVKDRRKLINQELALTAREREEARGALIAAMSKLEAAKQLENRATHIAAQVQIRRANY